MSREDLEWHLDVFRRGFLAFDDVMASPPRAAYWWTLVPLFTADARFADPWRAGQVTTGVAEVDDVLRRAYIRQVQAAPVDGVFYLYSRRWLVPATLARELEVAPTITIGTAPTMFTQEDDVVIEPHPDGNDEVFLVYRRGWGECFVMCTGQHWWRVRVTPTTSNLVSDWGSPIPVDVLESWKQPDPLR